MTLTDFLKLPEFGSYINGALAFDKKSHPQSFISPVNGKEWKKIHYAGKELAQRVIASCEKAWKEWKQVPGPIRSKVLRKIGYLMDENKCLLAEVMAMEMGKPITEGGREVDYSSGYFHWFAGEAERDYGQIIPSQYAGKRLMILHEPIGVCGFITPWNFPLAMGARKIAAALAAGCCLLVKPASECPISMLLLAEIGRLAGLPNGAFNVVIGPEKEIGEEILSSPIVRKLSFTGSTEVGKYLYARSADTLKKLTLELGGHAPLLVFGDADLNKAVAGTIGAKFRNNGQTCIAANRIFVQKDIFKDFLLKLKESVQKLKVGDPLDSGTELSTVLHAASKAKVKAHVEDAKSKGAKVELAGEQPYQPVILSGVTKEMILFREETFGPVAPLIEFKTVDEGIEKANDSIYGLAAYAFTEALGTANKVMDKLQYGIIGINDGLPSTPQASFGGIKHSGFGREGGPTGLREYQVEKYVSIGS